MGAEFVSRLLAILLFLVALVVALGWAFHNYSAWVAAGLILFVASFLPWEKRTRR